MPSSDHPGSSPSRTHRVTTPILEFLSTEAGGGAVLLAATVVALVWANSPWSNSYENVWTHSLTLGFGEASITHDLRHWVNEGLMTLFFFVMGLEVKRELVAGELASVRNALLPVIAAAGGMALPAALYLAVNLGGDGSTGWGIPMATDIAFAVGVLSFFRNVPASARVLLLSLAIVDDIGAIALIAAFYSAGLAWAPLVVAAGVLAAIGLLRLLRVRSLPVYGALAVLLWIATARSGVHATIAGVALGVMVPARAAERDRSHGALAERLLHRLHPWTSYAIVPLFAVANAGVELSAGSVAGALTSRVALGVALGLVVGKLLGIGGAVWAAVRLGLRPPLEGGWRTTGGVAALAGIGFTVSLFIAELAFDDPASVAEAKIGILAGSILSFVLGAAILSRARSARS